MKNIKNRKITLEMWIERFKNVHNTEEFKKEHGFDHYDYTEIKEILDCHEKIEICCIKHNYKFLITPANHYHHKKGCKICAKNFPLDNNKMDEILKDRNIKRLDNVFGIHLPINWKCTKKLKDGTICDYVWKTSPNNIIHGRSCPSCSKKARLDNNRIDKQLIEQGRDSLIKRIEDVKNSITKIKWKCNKCDYEWLANPNNVINNETGCPECDLSHGEFATSLLLKKFNYQYKIEHCFYDCINSKTGKLLYFDFVIYDENGNIIFLIEYQGEQHFKPMRYDYFNNKIYSEEASLLKLKSQQYRDQLKRDYCASKNIPLIEIPYWEFDSGNLEKYLLEKIINLSSRN